MENERNKESERKRYKENEKEIGTKRE